MFQSLYHVFRVKNHKEIKDKIFNHINSRQKTPTNEGFFISNTDWIRGTYVPLGDYHYIDFLLKDNYKNLDKFYKRKFLKDKQYQITNAWFNQYDASSGSEHIVHNHPRNDITNIYYMELESKDLVTRIIHPKTKKVIIPRVREGDILSFRGDLNHFSPKNFTKTRKTIVAFNIDIV